MKAYLKWGVIGGLVLACMNILALALQAQYLSYFNWIIMVGVIILALKEQKAENDGFLKYGEGVATGVLTGVFWGLVSGIITFVYLKFIDPDVMIAVYRQVEDQFYEQGMSDEQIEQAMKFSKMFSGPWVQLIGGPFGGAFSGLIISLIATIFFKENPPHSPTTEGQGEAHFYEKPDDNEIEQTGL